MTPIDWDAETARKFLSHRRLANDRLYVVWHFAVATGVRRGVLHGIRRDDVDLDAGLVHVRRQRTEVRGVIQEESVRGRVAPDPVPLEPTTVALLKRHPWVGGYLVSDPRAGSPYRTMQTFRRDWLRAQQNAGVPCIRIDELRRLAPELRAVAGEVEAQYGGGQSDGER